MRVKYIMKAVSVHCGNINLTVRTGDYVSVTGASGSGKSTLMHVLGLLDTLTGGSYLLDGEDVLPPAAAGARAPAQRTDRLVFQRFQLMPGMTALENVALPLALQGVARAARLARAAELLEMVGLSGRMEHKPGQLSGGQQQRVAIARAVVANPAVVLADEPTAGLDPAAAEEVLSLLGGLHRAGNTVVLITHDHHAAACAERRVTLENGILHGGQTF